MIGKILKQKAIYTILFSIVAFQIIVITTVRAQYYPPGANMPPSQMYDPYAGSYQPGSAPYGYSQPGYSQPPQGYPPASPYGYPPPPQPDTSYGYPPGAAGPSPGGYTPYPDNSGSVGAGSYPPPSGYPSTPPTTVWPSPTSVNGIKYTYSPQAGDYFNAQPGNSGRWEQFPITMHLTFPEGISAQDKLSVKAAISAWQKYADIKLVNRPDQARIELDWVSDLSNEEELGETEFKATHTNGYGKTVIDKVVIRMQDPSRYGNVYPEVLKSALMHQLGHALGISSHSDNDRDLMAEPTYIRPKNAIVKKAVRSIALQALGQFLDLPNNSAAPNAESKKKPSGPPVIKISKRDLNTLFRIYSQ